MPSFRHTLLFAVLLFIPQAARADIVLDWNVKLFETVTGQSPFGTARSPPSPSWRFSKPSTPSRNHTNRISARSTRPMRPRPKPLRPAPRITC